MSGTDAVKQPLSPVTREDIVDDGLVARGEWDKLRTHQ